MLNQPAPCRLALPMVLLLAACASKPAAPATTIALEGCTANSDCPSGQHCDSAGKCTSDCASESDCPLGYACSVSGECVFQPPTCGTGKVEVGEACDDGNQTAGDGCFNCVLESDFSCSKTSPSVCARLPSPPVVEGEASTGHDDPLWRWTVSANAVSYEVRVDGGDFQPLGLIQSFRASGLALGVHTFEVRACNGVGGCSATASFATVFELLGEGNTPAWRGVARDLVTTALGNDVGVVCHNCYALDTNNTVANATQANARISKALGRNADLIEIDVVDEGGVLVASHADDSAAGTPTLAALLDNPVFASSDAMLFIELKETGVSPDAFATELLDLLDTHREYARNGRPLWIRGFSEAPQGASTVRLNARVAAIARALPGYPFLEPYVRLSVLYGATDLASTALFKQDLIGQQAGGIAQVEFEFHTAGLPELLRAAHRLGLGVAVYTIPTTYFEVFSAEFREDVDVFIADTRADHVRGVMEEANVIASLDALSLTAARTAATYRREDGRLSGTYSASLVPPNAATPLFDASFGGALGFASSTSSRLSLAVAQPIVPAGPSGNENGSANDNLAGLFFTVAVRFDAIPAVSRRPILSSWNGSSAGAELRIDNVAPTPAGSGQVVWHIVYDSNLAAGSVSVATATVTQATLVNVDQYYLVTGAHDGAGGVRLWVDNVEAPAVFASGNTIIDENDPVVIGRNVTSAYLDGRVLGAQVLRWSASGHPFNGEAN